jgi:hypothetical protein
LLGVPRERVLAGAIGVKVGAGSGVGLDAISGNDGCGAAPLPSPSLRVPIRQKYIVYDRVACETRAAHFAALDSLNILRLEHLGQ